MIAVRCFVSHAFDDGLYVGGREAFKQRVGELIAAACAQLGTDDAKVGFELFFEATGYGRPLLPEVRRQIRECDFLIADISQGADGAGPVNPNVMYEIGYAMALEKGVIVMRHAASKPPPSDIADLLAGTYDRLEDLPGLFLDEAVRRVTETLAKANRATSRIEPMIAQVWFPPDTRTINLVCSAECERSRFAYPTEANYLHIDNFEDRDALFELSTFFARRYPDAQVVRHLCDSLPQDALSGNLVVLGGPGCVDGEGNSVAKDLMNALRSEVRYPEEGDGLIYRDDEIRLSRFDKDETVTEDWGTFLAAQNPYNPSSRIILLHGTLTFGTLAAATALIDTPTAMKNHIRLAGMGLVDRFSGAAQFEVLVKAEVGAGKRLRPPVLDFETVRRIGA